MLTPSEQNGLLGPDKLYPDADFSKLIITCSYNVYAKEREEDWEKQRQKIMSGRWKKWGIEEQDAEKMKNRCSIPWPCYSKSGQLNKNDK